MSILAGRVAGKEGAYFYQESKKAVTRLAQKTNNHLPSLPTIQESQADVLPEILRHSLPSRIFHNIQTLDSPPSLSTSSKWVLHSHPNNLSSLSADVLNPLRAYVSMPQVSFGSKRWELPNQDHSVLASTANELRLDKYTPVNPEKLKAAAEGLSRIGSAFAVATAIVFGGATLVFGIAASKLDLHSCDDIRTKGKDLFQPKLESFKEQVTPFRNWAERMSKRWRLEKDENIKEKPIIKELSKILGPKTSP